MKGRRFLFLQGVCSPFFARLAGMLRAEGAFVRKIHFNTGDVAYWREGEDEVFRGALPDLPAFIAEGLQQHRISDLVLFGDCRPVHRLAIATARPLGVRSHVFEEGYFRPWWFTLEREGVNRYSRLPRDPDWYREVAPKLPSPEPHVPFEQAFSVRAFHDVLYHLAGAFNPVFFPNYRTHAQHLAPREYAGYARRFLRTRLRQAHDEQAVSDLMQASTPFFLLPLQLNNDAQIREHSPFANMPEVLLVVLESFARAAPAGTKLLIKNHPLDYGTVDYSRVIIELAREFALERRVSFIESGPLASLVAHCAGVVTVNSTVGAVALDQSRPLFTLGEAIYHMPGLSFSGMLDEFWQHAEAPDSALYQAFRRVVMHATQINGGFYTRPAIEIALRNVLPALAAVPSRLEYLLACDPLA
jgi:capsular polysaccharide export protein